MWYYLKNDEMIGSISFEEIVNLINAGVITSSTYVWQSGKKRQRASQVEELAPYFKNVTQTSSRQNPFQNAASPPEKTAPGANPQWKGAGANTQSCSVVKNRSRCLTKQSEGAPPSKKEKTCRIILTVCLVIAALSLLLCFLFNMEYKRELEQCLVEYSQKGFYRSISNYDIIIPLQISFIVTLVAFVTGFLIKQYKITVVCLIITIICFAIPYSVSKTSEQQYCQIEQHLNAIPGYQELKRQIEHCKFLSKLIEDMERQGDIQCSISRNMINELERIHYDSKTALEALINGSNDPSILLHYQEDIQTVLQINNYIKELRSQLNNNSLNK